MIGDGGWVYISIDGWLQEVLVFYRVVVGKWLWVLLYFLLSHLSLVHKSTKMEYRGGL